MAASTAPASPAAMRCGPAMSASWRRPGWLRSDGIDSFGAGGERDGFDNRAASLKVEARPDRRRSRFGVVGHWIEGRSEYDGFDPVTFLRADTLDETRNRIAAVRGWASGDWGGWSLRAEASYLDSANRNRLAGAPLNSTFGDRLDLRRASSRGGSAATG